jgi:hypothetical protein
MEDGATEKHGISGQKNMESLIPPRYRTGTSNQDYTPSRETRQCREVIDIGFFSQSGISYGRAKCFLLGFLVSIFIPTNSSPF